MSAELTPLFSGAVKPVRKGVYKRTWPDGRSLDYPFYLWDGERWLANGHATVLGASEYSQGSAMAQDWPWCGLAADPSKQVTP